jgi:hypothetical protein
MDDVRIHIVKLYQTNEGLGHESHYHTDNKNKNTLTDAFIFIDVRDEGLEPPTLPV